METANAKKQNKHVEVISASYRLSDALDSMDNFLDRLERGEKPNDVGAKLAQAPESIPFVEMLDGLPKDLDSKRQRVINQIERLGALLY